MSSIRPTTPLRFIARSVAKMAYEHRVMFGAIWLTVTILGVLYANLSPRLWPVTIPLTVRDETGLSQRRPGEFASNEARRTSQETVLQLANSTSVLRAALARVENSSSSPEAPISTDAIEKAQKRIRLAPPKGVDWGASELFFLTVKDEDSARAIVLAKSLVMEIDRQLGELRHKRNNGLAIELEQSLEMAEAELSTALKKMGDVEAQLGPDLAEMRIMTEPSSGESNLRRTLTEVSAELRQTRSQIDGSRTLLELLEAARQDPSHLIATPGRLLESQPSLRKLKEGIVDAENRTAQLRGNLLDSHPKVRAAKMVEDQSRKQLFTELALAVDGVKIEIRVGEDRLAELQARRNEIEQRLGRLAEVRAEYGLLSNQVKDRSDVVKRTREQLAEVHSSRAAAETVSVLTSVEAPLVGLRPDGPGRSSIYLLSFVGGFLLASTALLAVTPSAQWRAILRNLQEDSDQLELEVEHGVLAAWLGNAQPLRRERLPASIESSPSPKP